MRAPSPDRVQKVLSVIDDALQQDALDSVVAQRLAGKLNFLSTTLFGQAAASALKPLYSRAHDRNDQVQTAFNGPLRCSLLSLRSMLRHAEPKWIPFHVATEASAVVYADAFFELGDQSFGLSDEPPTTWTSNSFRSYANGWGFVVRSSRGIRFAHGSVPSDVLALFTSRRAYIYCLEIFGQVLAALTCHEILGPCWLGFCDNTAGKAALVRGYGRDASINNLLACFWALCQRLHWQPHFEWVPSDLNIADPFSRGDCSIGISRGWEALHSDLADMWSIFRRVAVDLHYALEGAPADLLHLRYDFVRQGSDASSLGGVRAATRRS